MHEKKSRGTAGFLSILAYMPEYWRTRILLHNLPYLNTQIQGIYREICHFYHWIFDALTTANIGILRFLLLPVSKKNAKLNRELYITNLDVIYIFVPWSDRLQSILYLPPKPSIILCSFCRPSQYCRPQNGLAHYHVTIIRYFLYSIGHPTRRTYRSLFHR